jgi:hypothetical protein
MIHVVKRKQPARFSSEVEVLGQAWLAANPVKKKGEKLPPLWQKCLPELRQSYKGICAYFCIYVRPATGASSADHFIAKSSNRALAYSWDNYRFACSRMNARKNDASDVLDPFTILDGWFELYFPTMQVRPAKNLSAATLQAVRSTIRRLKLNSHECCQECEEYWNDYYQNGLAIDRLFRYAPFIALEAVRQNLLHSNDLITSSTIRSYLDS